MFLCIKEWQNFDTHIHILVILILYNTARIKNVDTKILLRDKNLLEEIGENFLLFLQL